MAGELSDRSQHAGLAFVKEVRRAVCITRRDAGTALTDVRSLVCKWYSLNRSEGLSFRHHFRS